MKNWKSYKVKDICDINQTTFSKKDNWEYVNYLDTGNITENVIDSIQYIDLKEQKLPSRAKRKVKFNSIIYSTVRPNQKHFGIIKKKPENFLVSTGFAVIDPHQNIDADFLYYRLCQPDITMHLQAIAEQSVSAYPSIKPTDIGELEICLPEYEEQKRISSFFLAIDQKIAINRAINKNLTSYS